MNHTLNMYRHVHVSIDPADLEQFDEWARENRLPRGAAMGAMVRLLRALPRGVPTGPGGYTERVVELDEREPT